ncbi:MAG: hypothetical protein LBP25_00450 [Tannerellaceae bacterium]|nr:hypothetical protein [Tannerellaceae bacterium]
MGTKITKRRKSGFHPIKIIRRNPSQQSRTVPASLFCTCLVAESIDILAEEAQAQPEAGGEKITCECRKMKVLQGALFEEKAEDVVAVRV